MGYFWFMAVETDSHEAAKQFAASFDSSQVKVSGPGFAHTIKLLVVADLKDDIWWGVTIFPTFALREGDAYPVPVASRGGTETAEHAEILTQLGRVLYERLLRTTPFDVAMIGFEPEGFFGFGEHDDLVDDLRQGWTCDGLVVSAALWEAAGKPSGLVPRSDGTYWDPWKGETFKEPEP